MGPFDVVIVGAGVAGAVLAKQLSNKGVRVLILEAGRATPTTVEGYRSHVETFYETLVKTPSAPYPDNPFAPSPNVVTLKQIEDGVPDDKGYFVQMGPLPFSSDYERARGGSTLHFLGTFLRLLPTDFKLKTLYGQGEDWPITYEELRPYYEMAEWEVGVSADVEDQRYPGVGADYFRPKPSEWRRADGQMEYHFPMRKIPQSYLDKELAKGLQECSVDASGEAYALWTQSTPQGRNSVPNFDPSTGELYRPFGHVGDPEMGQRCEGNASCVPICPVQAKYNALKTLAGIRQENVTILTQAVATRIEFDPNGRVAGISYKLYQDEHLPSNWPENVTEDVARGSIYVIAAHAIESAKLLLASTVANSAMVGANSSGQVGRNLMDHPILLTWGLMPKPIGSFRGPGSTSGIPTFRDGRFRIGHAAFGIPINNYGWRWPENAPYSTLDTLVRKGQLFGKGLRAALQEVSRQFALQFEFEQLPGSQNRVTIDRRYRDALGSYRPVIHYDISEYTRAAMPVAKSISDQIFQAVGAEDRTCYRTTHPGYLEYEGKGYFFEGAGHLVGTHRMGDSPSDSVVNRDQRTWDHDNLYLVGTGTFPTIGTCNPTLTVAALALSAAENILRDLKR